MKLIQNLLLLYGFLNLVHGRTCSYNGIYRNCSNLSRGARIGYVIIYCFCDLLNTII